MKKHIGLFGGAFNPITKAHIQTAEYVIKKFKSLDEVWIMPAYSHTFNKQMVEGKQRVAMCKLASKIKVFDYEIKKKISGGTLNLFNILSQDPKYKNYEFWWIIGMDNANIIHKWVNSQELIKKVRFIVIQRNGVEQDKTQDWYMKYPHIFISQKNPIIETSSTEVRSLLENYYIYKSKETLEQLKERLNESVLKYILKHKLYEKVI